MQSKSAFTIHIPASFQATHLGGKKGNVTNEHTLCIICHVETLFIFQIPSVQTDLGQTGRLQSSLVKESWSWREGANEQREDPEDVSLTAVS